jgi:hypothetical protein
MAIDKKIISEIQRYHFINNYLNEQEVPPPPSPLGSSEPAPETPAPAAEPAPEADTAPQIIDVETDTEVEKIDDAGKSEETGDEEGTEELDITDLVKSQENIETRQEEYFNNLFSQVSNLESKLGEMDAIINKLNSLESKIEKYREKTPQEKLELRTYDSYPFNQKLTDFFEDKKEEMEKTGKHDYVLTTDDVTDINDRDIKDSFLLNPDDEEQY